MRVLLFALFLAACEDPYADAQKLDTIEGWDTFLANDPSATERVKAENRLQELLLDKAMTSSKLEDYDAFLKRFPKSKDAKQVKDGRATAHFQMAENENTPEAWQKFLDENPEADTTMRKKASSRVQVATYVDKLTIGEVKVEQVNLAEDPKGPKDGWGFSVEVTNAGDKTIDYLNMEVQLLDDAGAKLAAKTYPLAGQSGPGGMSLPEEYTKPFKPGDKRTWVYSTGEAPENWHQKVKVVPVGIRFSGNLAEGEK